MIALDPDFARIHGRDATEAAIRRIVCSVRFDLPERQSALRLLGPDMTYHTLDPHLPAALPAFDCTDLGDLLAFRRQGAHWDLCFEDSWSGYFIADRIRNQPAAQDLVLVHLDDHTDMMPTLLSAVEGSLTDWMRGMPFDPSDSADWEQSIHTGCVSIGNFITPLYYSKHRLHVRHLHNRGPAELVPVEIFQEPICHGLLPGVAFAGLRRGERVTGVGAGTYGVATDARSILADLPPGKVIVHIDLDYFVNDFNGNPRVGDYLPDPCLATDGREKLRRFFVALESVDCVIDRWIIGTSPGFCSALHWPWLLREIEERIGHWQSR